MRDFKFIKRVEQLVKPIDIATLEVLATTLFWSRYYWCCCLHYYNSGNATSTWWQSERGIA